jgi:hypothetical protein
MPRALAIGQISSAPLPRTARSLFHPLAASRRAIASASNHQWRPVCRRQTRRLCIRPIAVTPSKAIEVPLVAYRSHRLESAASHSEVYGPGAAGLRRDPLPRSRACRATMADPRHPRKMLVSVDVFASFSHSPGLYEHGDHACARDSSRRPVLSRQLS